MESSDYLLEAISQLSGGLITDLKTLFVGAVVLAFILMGFDYIKDAFNHMLETRAHGRFLENAEDMRMERDQYMRGSTEWEEANYMYRHFVGKAAKSRLRSWGE